MTIRLPNEIEERLTAEAARQGVTPDELAAKVIQEKLAPAPPKTPSGRNSLEELFAKWAEEDPSEGPEDIARRNEEVEEFKRAMNRNRQEMEGPNSRMPLM